MKPSVTLMCFQIFLWGAFLIGQGGAQSFGDMVALRIVSGAAEAVAKPAFSELRFENAYLQTVAITAMWFTRPQQPTVMGLWYASQGAQFSHDDLITRAK